MIFPDYFTNCKWLLENFEANLDEKLTALAAFNTAVNEDWDMIRKRSAIDRLNQAIRDVNALFDLGAPGAALSEIKKYVPLDPVLSHAATWAVKAMTGTDFGTNATTPEEQVNSIL